MTNHEPIYVRLGSQRYEVCRGWPVPKLDLHGICDVCVLSDGRVVVLRRRTPQLLVLSADGVILDEWTVPGLVSGHYMRARQNGGLLITDLCSHVVLMLDGSGRQVGMLGRRGDPQWNAPFNNPTSAVEDQDGRIYVTDGYGNSCLHCFNADGSLRFTIGQAGSGHGEFTTPHAVVVDERGDVFVGDRENNRIQVFDREGQWKRQIGLLYKPMAIALRPAGGLLVSDQTPRLSLFSTQGELLGRCRTYGVYGHGVAAGPDGAIYIAEMAPDSLTKLVPVAV